MAIKITEKQLVGLKDHPSLPDEIRRKIAWFKTCRSYPCADMQRDADELSKELKDGLEKNVSEEILKSVKQDSDKSEKDPGGEQGSRTGQARLILPIHRKNFGVKAIHVEKLLDKGTGDPSKGEKCDRYCHSGARWVHHGLMNITQILIEGRVARLSEFRDPNGFRLEIPDAVFDVLNVTEIYAFLCRNWLGKFFRDEMREPNSDSELDPNAIDTTPFPQLMATIVDTGKRMLKNHWNYEALSSDSGLNPYLSTYNSLVERFGLVPSHLHSVVKRILKLPLIQPERKDKRSDDYRPGFECKKDAWKEDEGRRHVKRGDLPEEKRKKGQFDDERAYASTVLQYFKEKEELWFPWHDEMFLKNSNSAADQEG